MCKTGPTVGPTGANCSLILTNLQVFLALYAFEQTQDRVFLNWGCPNKKVLELYLGLAKTALASSTFRLTTFTYCRLLRNHPPGLVCI